MWKGLRCASAGGRRRWLTSVILVCAHTEADWMAASLSALHVTPEPDAMKCTCRAAHCSVLTAEDDLWRIFQSRDLFLPLLPPFPLLFTSLSSPLIVVFFFLLLLLLTISFLSSFLWVSFSFVLPPVSSDLSPSPLPPPGSAGGVSEQPRHRPQRHEQRRRRRSLPQHQKGSLPRDLQPAGNRAPSGGWGNSLQPLQTLNWGRQRLQIESEVFLFSVLVCENGWRCCLINRDRKMPTDYIRNGVLYVTEK